MRIRDFFDTFNDRSERALEIFLAALALPIFVPLYIRRDGPESLSSLLLLLALNGIVVLHVYLYLVSAALFVLGVPDEHVGILAPLSSDPKPYFGTFFFSLFFPLMAFYLYITRTDRWGIGQFREHFAERVPTEVEIRAAEEEKWNDREKIRQFLALFRKRFPWFFGFLLALFSFANFGAEGATPWGEIFLLSLFSSAMLVALSVVVTEDRRKQRERKERKAKRGK